MMIAVDVMLVMLVGLIVLLLVSFVVPGSLPRPRTASRPSRDSIFEFARSVLRCADADEVRP